MQTHQKTVFIHQNIHKTKKTYILRQMQSLTKPKTDTQLEKTGAAT